MDVILWRHAEAEDTYPDYQRKLTTKGKKQAAKVAAWLKKRIDGPFRVVASPTARTAETARALSGEVELNPVLGATPSASEVLRVAGWPGGDGTVVIVGHQPTMGQVVSLLLTGHDATWSVKKGAIWWFRLSGRPPVPEAVLVASLGPEMA